MALIELKNIVKKFPVRKSFFGRVKEFVRAVDGVSLSVERGETLGLVGESGCGKSTLGRIAIGIIKQDSGEIVSECKLSQMIFQDPFSSLNPRMSVGDIVTEPLIVNKLISSRDRKKKAEELLNDVGMDGLSANRYPHEFSGGQRQRISIARAISLKPRFIVADEPVSSLDVIVQKDILSLMKKLQAEHGITYLFITHDLRLVANHCDRVAVMYMGKIVEQFKASDLKKASHPYTLKLLASVPRGVLRLKEEAK